MRTTLGQVQQSRLPAAIGACANDLPSIAAIVNQGQWELILTGGETGFWGGWWKVVFNVSRCDPYITMPREFARIINMTYCRGPVRIQNEFYEMMEASIGLQDFCRSRNWCGAVEGFERGVWPVKRDLTPTNQYLRVRITDDRDVGRRILFGPSTDQNGNAIYSQDGLNSVNGFYLPFEQPFSTSEFIVSTFQAVQKDATFGDVLVYQVDATTGEEVLLSRYAPDEITPAYRRYFLSRLPCSCGPVQAGQSPCIAPVTSPGTVQVSAMAKLEFIPANRATDFLIIGNIPALIAICQAVRYDTMDSPTAPALAQKARLQAVRLMNSELRHYMGEMQPAVNFAPFGTARLGYVMDAVQFG